MAQVNATSLSGSIEELITSYHELNPAAVEELSEAPSPLEFMRYVARNTPFVVRGGASHWPAMSWTTTHLDEAMKDASVELAVTPSGNADAVVERSEDSTAYVATPLKVEEPFSNFLQYVTAQESGIIPSSPVKYAQTQNDNLRNEYSKLYEDVEEEIPWARIALGHSPEAINLWIGNSKSVTALHRDNYENIYCQVLGTKHFVLLPPIEAPCVNETLVSCAQYQGDVGILSLIPTEPEEKVPAALWDPDSPEKHPTPFSKLSRPLRVSLNAGDLLYLPALW